jgi:hypothetical protein
MTVNAEEPDIVTGTLYGSAIGLFLALAIPLLLVSMPLSLAGVWSWAAPVAVVIVGSVGTPWIRRRSTLTVSDEGVTLLQAGTLVFVPWSNVESLSDGWFPALVFREPQRMGWRNAKRLRFDGFDPKWRTRQTSAAIAREFARSRTTHL